MGDIIRGSNIISYCEKYIFDLKVKKIKNEIIFYFIDIEDVARAANISLELFCSELKTGVW